MWPPQTADTKARSPVDAGNAIRPSDPGAVVDQAASRRRTRPAGGGGARSLCPEGGRCRKRSWIWCIGGDWHTALSTLPDSRGIRVGFISRLPVTVLADSADFPAALAPLQADDSVTIIATNRGAEPTHVPDMSPDGPQQP